MNVVHNIFINDLLDTMRMMDIQYTRNGYIIHVSRTNITLYFRGVHCDCYYKDNIGRDILVFKPFTLDLVGNMVEPLRKIKVVCDAYEIYIYLMKFCLLKDIIKEICVKYLRVSRCLDEG